MADDARGAVDLGKCRDRHRRWGNCRCEPACAVCGYGKHMAVHGPEYGQLPGSRPWHHEYVTGEGPPTYTDNPWNPFEHPCQEWPTASRVQQGESET